LDNPESGANCILCLIHQTNFLLDQQLKSLEKEFKLKGDFNDRKKEIKKEKFFGNDEEEYQKILKESGFKKLNNGRVVRINSEEK
jgi:four helix bundle suffix protein